MCVRFFIDNMYQPMYDRRQVQFNDWPGLPAPPYAFIFEHFRQCVLANMKGAGKVRVYDYDPNDDAQSIGVFERGEGKEWFEGLLEERLWNVESPNGGELEVS